MAGWIKTYRDLTDHWLSQDLQKLGWWVILLLKVNHEDKKVLSGNQLIDLKKGQIIASLSYLASLWKTSKRTAERFLDLLERDQMVSRCVRQKITIITICNWNSYQGSDESRCANTRVDDEPMMSRLVSETKKEEEIYLDNIINNAPAHTREEKAILAYAKRYREEGMWADAAMPAHITIDKTKEIFNIFIREQIHNESKYSSYIDFKRHFLNYLRNNAEIQRKQTTKNNGNNKPSQRRGIQVVANSVDDYEGPF